MSRPFLTWPGGKQWLLDAITRHFQTGIQHYWEPFVGGGAVFFALHNPYIQTATLSDVNRELIITYHVVKTRCNALMHKLREHSDNHSDTEYYYRIRAQVDLQDPIEIAARQIYLSKTCFNGLYRVNSQGNFNQARSHKTPVICDDMTLRDCQRALQKVTLRCGDFTNIRPKAGDFVYCDPPYDAATVQYNASMFDSSKQEELAECARKWHNAGAQVLISNNNTDFIR